jgi:superkiller protein 3
VLRNAALSIALLLAASPHTVPAQHLDRASIEDLINQDRLAEARDRLQALRSEQAPNARTLLLEAMLLHKEGKYVDSLRRTQAALEADPRNSDCHKIFGLNLVRLGREDLASDYFEAAASLNPQDYMAWYYLGLQQLQAKRPQESLTSLLKVVDLRPDYVDGYYVLGLAYEQLSDYEKALEAYRRAIAIQERRNSQTDTPHLYMGRLLIALARYGESIAELEKAVHLKPDGHEAWTELGRAMIEAGRVEDALAPLQKAVQLKSDNGAAHYQLMRANKQLGREREARQAMEMFRRLEQAKKPRP